VLEHEAIQRATARDKPGRRKKEPRTQYYRDDFIPPQRSNARRIATDGRNAGLVNNNVVCYANAIFQIIACCGCLNKALCNTPSIRRHAYFNLYYNFASVISSMIRGGNEAVDPVIFTDVFSAHVPQFNHKQRKYSVVRNVLFFIGFLFTHQLFMLANVRGCTRVYNGTEDVPA
jgi:ubiquitin C-terminal hydrolase